MSDRVSQVSVLCEDETHEGLVTAYMKLRGLRTKAPFLKRFVASKSQSGGNDNWVLNEFPRELHACRQRHKTKGKSLLIVVLDADKYSVEDRRRQLFERVKAAGFEEYGQNEPAVLLIPKRTVETWINVLLGKTVTEDQNCKTYDKPNKEDYRQSAETLFKWSRDNATQGPNCVDSLKAALSEWRKIG